MKWYDEHIEIMRLDPIEILFANAITRFRARFWILIWIYLIPGVLLVGGQLLSARNDVGAIAGFAGGTLSLLGSIGSVIATLAIINALAHGTDVEGSYRVATKLFGPSVWIILLNMLAIAGGTVLFIVPGIILGVALMFANYILVVEDKRGMRALALSWGYVRGYWWAVVGRVVLASLIFAGVIMLIYLPAFLIFGPAIASMAYLAIMLCFTAFSSCYMYELYQNLRRLKPGAATAPAEEGRKFIYTCIAFGIIAIVVILLLIGVAIF